MSDQGRIHVSDARTAARKRHRDVHMLQPGEVLCPVDDQPGMALIDDRGVRVYHPRQGRSPFMACRFAGPFSALVAVADLPALARFAAGPAATPCERCRHTRGDHVADGVDLTILHGGELPGCPCGCPGPGGVIHT